MILEDTREFSQKAAAKLISQREEVGTPDLEIQPLEDYLRMADSVPLAIEEKEKIVDWAITIVENLYAHLPFKRARYAVNPAQRLRLLRFQAGSVSSSAFHTAMVEILTELRDAHTHYALPEPYKGCAAFLPFFLSVYWEGDQRRFVVSRVMDGLEHPTFVPGVEVTFWNGTPIERAVLNFAERTPGSNPAARFARALDQLTLRVLTFLPPPEEEMVFVQYRPMDGSEERVTVWPWNVGRGLTARLFVADENSSQSQPMVDTNRACEILCHRDRVIYEHGATAGATAGEAQSLYPNLVPAPRATKPKNAKPKDAKPSAPDIEHESRLPGSLEFQYTDGSPDGPIHPAHLSAANLSGGKKNRKFGYIKIKDFPINSDAFFEEFLRLLELMRDKGPGGLILDIRGNRGGSVLAAERILQLLTPAEITPCSFQLTNSPLLQKIGEILDKSFDRTQPDFTPWLQDLRESLVSGDLVTRGQSLTSVSIANDTGQKYHGPVVLLIDARVYSAAEIFAGGFLDHEIGTVLGVADNTGGGGANRWFLEDFQARVAQIRQVASSLPVPGPLPGNATLAFAFRRSSRVGRNRGIPIEDFGVSPHQVLRPTKGDILAGDCDLLRRACETLADQPAYHLEVLEASLEEDSVKFVTRARNLRFLDCSLDDGLAFTTRLGRKEVTPLTLPLLQGWMGRNPKRLTIKGYASSLGDGAPDKIVAKVIVDLPRRKRTVAKKASPAGT